MGGPILETERLQLRLPRRMTLTLGPEWLLILLRCART
jgi:hypothetical protein